MAGKHDQRRHVRRGGGEQRRDKVDRGDAVALSRLHAHEPLTLKPQQSLSHRRFADLVLPGQRLLAQFRARLQAAFQDAGADGVVAVFIGVCAELAALDLREQVAGLAIPVLALVGGQGEATPPAMARQLAGLLPDARLAELPGLAHLPQLQDTGGFVATVEPFLAAAG